VAAFLQPEVLVVDEVLAVGDTAFQKQAIARMQEVSKGGCTILFVSHNLTAVRSLCKRSILLNDGALVYEGSTAHCLAKYLGYEAAPGSLRRTWSGLDAPAGGSFRMSEAEVCALLPDGSSTDMLDVSLPLRIRVGIACDGVKVPDVSVHILSDEGEFLAASSTLYHRDASRRPEQRGDVVYHSCTIPAHFFNHHSYRLRVLVVEDRITTVLRLDDLFHISFVPPARPESTWMGHTASHFIVGWEWA
jgi:lipopolysaccharide transport system ATP-binding protein